MRSIISEPWIALAPLEWAAVALFSSGGDGTMRHAHAPARATCALHALGRTACALHAHGHAAYAVHAPGHAACTVLADGHAVCRMSVALVVLEDVTCVVWPCGSR